MGGREDRFSELIQRYATLVRSAVAKVEGHADRDLGDEILQRVSEALWKQVRAEREISHPASYLYRGAGRSAC